MSYLIIMVTSLLTGLKVFSPWPPTTMSTMVTKCDFVSTSIRPSLSIRRLSIHVDSLANIAIASYRFATYDVQCRIGLSDQRYYAQARQ